MNSTRYTSKAQIWWDITEWNLSFQLYNCPALQQSFNSRVIQNLLFTVNSTRNVTFLIILLCRLIYNITAHVQNVRHQDICILWVLITAGHWMCWWHVVQWCAKHLVGVTTKHHDDVKWCNKNPEKNIS